MGMDQPNPPGKDAFLTAYTALKAEARVEHPDPPPGAVVARDPCRCGQSTVTGKSKKCCALIRLDELYRGSNWESTEDDRPDSHEEEYPVVTIRTTYKEAFEMALSALKEKARAAHPNPVPGAIVTRDMCPCGQTTGVGKTEMCRVLGLLWQMHRETPWETFVDDVQDEFRA